MTERSPLTCRRDDFSIPAGIHYLNCAFMGPLPRSAEAAGRAGVERKATPWTLGPGDFFADSDRVRELFARIVGGAAGAVAIMPSVSYAVSTVARNVELEAGDELLLLDEQFPGNVYAWHRLAAEAGARVVTVPRPASRRGGDGTVAAGAEWNARIVEAIGPRTRVVALPPLHWTDGTRFDLDEIGRRARDVGAWFVVDATQAAGGTPLDVEALGCDLLVAGAYKWLLGPYSIALASVGPRLADGVPLEEGWIAREGSEDFQALVDYTDRYGAGAVRYDVGERSNFALLPIAIAALEAIDRWGVDRIESYVGDLVGPLVSAAVEAGYAVEEEGWRSRHITGIRMPEGLDLGDLKARLDEGRVYASMRGSSLRVSPNVYNDEADIAALVEILRTAAP